MSQPGLTYEQKKNLIEVIFICFEAIVITYQAPPLLIQQAGGLQNKTGVRAFLVTLVDDVKHQIDVSLVHPRYVMPKDEKHDVLVIRFRYINQDKAREVLDRLRHLDVAIEFESLYGERDALRTSTQGGGG